MADRSGRELRWDQVRQLTRLVGEAYQLPVDGGLRRQHTLDGIARILGSPAALVGASDPTRQVGSDAGMTDVALTGFDAVTRAAFEVMTEAGCSFNPAIRGMYGVIQKSPLGVHHVAPEQQLTRSRDWNESPYVVDHLRPAGLDHFLISARQAVIGHFGGFFRCRRDRHFDERDRNLLELFVLEHSELLWPGQKHLELSPRLRETLAHLLAGASAKEIAASLGLSVHTVNEYVGAIYRTYGVRSRGELFARVGKSS